MTVRLVKAGQAYGDGSGSVTVELSYKELAVAVDLLKSGITGWPSATTYSLISGLEKALEESTSSKVQQQARSSSRLNDPNWPKPRY